MSTAAENSAPPAVWLQWHGDGDPADPGAVAESEVTWSRERVFAGDVEYVQAAALRELVTTEHESKEDFIQRVRALLGMG